MWNICKPTKTMLCQCGKLACCPLFKRKISVEQKGAIKILFYQCYRQKGITSNQL